jgi:hypothetical protein
VSTISITKLLILLTIIVWVVWDFHAHAKGGVAATESGIIRAWARHPLVPFAVGILIGHLFACPM